MPWAKIDDQFYDHPKIVSAGPVAVALFVCGLSYCNRHMTDGFISKAQVKRLLDVDDSDAVADKLVTVGLWEKSDGGYQVHDYLEYNMSAEQIKADREANAKRLEEWRKRKEAERNAVSNSVTNTVTNNASNAVSNSVPVPSPLPDPVPSPLPVLTTSCAVAQTPVEPPQTHRAPSERDIVLDRLEKAFSRNSGIPLPPRKTVSEKTASAKRWWNPLWTIYNVTACADVDTAENLIAQSVAQMRRDNLTLSAPQSIQQVAASIAAKSNGNGAGHAITRRDSSDDEATLECARRINARNGK